MADEEVGDRNAFSERLRRQLQARYRDHSVTVDRDRFALHVEAPGIRTDLPLAPLYLSCQRDPLQTSALIAMFVNAVEKQLVPRRQDTGVALSRLIWCVRSRRYLDDLSRSHELTTIDIGGDLTGFVAESLPGNVMRGVARERWEEQGYSEESVRVAADENTATRFAPLVERIRSADRIPRDGWRAGSDTLFQGSVLLVQAVLSAFAERAGGEVLLANPDRSLVLAIPAAASGADRFAMRVAREWREAMNPASRSVFITDGSTLTVAPQKRRAPSVMGWLHE